MPKNTNATTILMADGVLTTLDYNKLKGATKLSVARTIIHELVHAYLVLYFKFDGLSAIKEYPQIVAAWQAAPDPDLNDIHHTEMAVSFVDEMALALKEYGRSIGLNVDDSVYTDLAWGGLDFQNSGQLTAESKKRIQQRLNAELLNTTVFTTHPVGPKMGG